MGAHKGHTVLRSGRERAQRAGGRVADGCDVCAGFTMRVPAHAWHTGVGGRGERVQGRGEGVGRGIGGGKGGGVWAAGKGMGVSRLGAIGHKHGVASAGARRES